MTQIKIATWSLPFRITYRTAYFRKPLEDPKTSQTEIFLYEGEWKENLKYFLFFIMTMWCANYWLISRCAAISFTVTRRFSFTMASTAAMASGVTTRCAWLGRGEFLTELMPFMNFLVHSYTCCGDRHASPTELSLVDEFRWVSPLHYKKRMTERFSSLVHVASGAAIFTLLLCRRV